MGIMNISEMMDRSIDLLRKYMGTIILFNLCCGLIVGAIYFALIFIGIIFSVVSISVLHNYILMAVLVSVLILFTIVLSLSIKTGMIKISSQEFLHNKVTLGNALGESFKNILKVFGLVVIVLLLASPIVAIFGVMAYFLYLGFKSSMIIYGIFHAKEVILIILSGLALIIFIFVLSAFSVVFSFTIHAIVLEKKGVISSIKRSYQLVKGSYWKVFGCTVLFGFTIAAIRASLGSIITVALTIIYFILKLFNLSVDYISFVNMFSGLLNWPLNILSMLMITPIVYIMLTMLYYNQRFKNDGFDILLRLKKLEIDEKGSN